MEIYHQIHQNTHLERQGSGFPQEFLNQLQAVPTVAANVFMRTLHKTIGFTIGNVWVLVEYEYDASDTMLYRKFSGI